MTVPAASPAAASTPDAAAPLAERFRDVPGLTMTRALLYLPGRDAVFARVVRQFVDTYRPGMPLLDSAVQGARWAEARRQLHSLRGACGAIGATGLLAGAAALEQRLGPVADGQTAPAAVIDDLAVLRASLLQLVQALDERLGGAAVPAPPGPGAGLEVSGQTSPADSERR